MAMAATTRLALTPTLAALRSRTIALALAPAAGAPQRRCSSSTATSALGPMHELHTRGLIQHTTSRALAPHLHSPTTTPRTIYLGIDPSAPSLHLGNLLPLFALFHLAHAGHRCIALVGGATGSIGDPSGRKSERSALDSAVLERNLDGIVHQLCEFFGKASEWAAQNLPPSPPSEATRGQRNEWEEVQSLLKRKETLAAIKVGHGSVFVVNNRPFYEQMNILDFLSGVGRHVRIGDMLARDSVKRRIQPTPSNPNPPGLSFTEFSYQLLQAYDFSLLHASPWNCTVQIGGSDQLGNIMAGIELIRREGIPSNPATPSAPAESGSTSESAAPAYGLTVPLLTTSTGAKFGKSAGNAVWLDPALTSDLDLYQYFLRSVTDADVSSLLSKLTLLPPDARSQEHLTEQATDSETSAAKGTKWPRAAQTILASHLTALLRGDQALERAKQASSILFSSSSYTSLPRSTIEHVFQGLPNLKRLPRAHLLGKEVWKVVADVGLAKSRAEARRTLVNGGVYLNSVGVGKAELGRCVVEADLLGRDGKRDAPGFLVVQSGKGSHAVILVD
ncbi:unnamed protein product [Tilletia laevis]|uniref:tyrosine--tRNA ligase n=2 Tax=Tilletia TaxID=13289 RepID=A0A177UEN8_9BASI|nr:hypothetical protein CF336_g5634 [Tilletia laevis]KAE8262249.1 hypothetical protein A4X03_0g2602 [Tilletia caries]KAE8194892.1 hypothetical protein CF335_g5225 [Tilletia laevis]CAD6892527.1 unnamed protein product [Tilletia caries]CAD6924453.1 unnamed protein product [Tilletia caries]